MSGMNHAGKREPGAVCRAHSVLCEADAFVATEDRSEVATIPSRDDPVALAQDRRHMGNLEPVGLTRKDRAAERFEALHEERAHEVGLEPPGLGLFHLLLHSKETLCAEALLGERVTR